MPHSVKLRVTRATCSTVTPLSIRASRRSDATSSPPDIAIHPLAFSRMHRSLVKLFSKRMLAHHVTSKFLFRISRASSRIRAGGAASSTK